MAKQEESIEKQLWKAADKLRKNIDAAEYKHVVMGLVFLKYISDSFEELYNALKTEEEMGADPEDRDEYKAENVFLSHNKLDGHFYFQMQNYQISEKLLMKLWMP